MHKYVDMKIATLSFAAGPGGLPVAVARLEELLGSSFRDGGFHPRFGTRNHILPIKSGRYLEVVEALEHPAADKAPFGQAVRARSALGGGWLTWVLEVGDMAAIEAKLGREAVHASRQFPDGRLLEWEQIGVKGLLNDPQLPYFIKWLSDDSVRPSALGPADVELLEIELAGSKDRLDEWLGFSIGETFDGVQVTCHNPNGQPGIDAVTFSTPKGIVRI